MKEPSVLFVRVEPELKQALERIAADHERSLSAEVRWLLVREVKRVGTK